MWRPVNLAWKGFIIVVIFQRGILTSRAWLVSVPTGYSSDPVFCRNRRCKSLSAKANKQRDENDNPKESGGFFNFFSRDKDSSIYKKDISESEEESSPGFFRSILNRYTGNKETRKAKREKELIQAIRDKELKDAQFLFNKSSFTSAFGNFEEGFTKVREGMGGGGASGIRSSKQPLTEEEKRSLDLRLRREAERQRSQGRIQPRKQAEQISS